MIDIGPLIRELRNSQQPKVTLKQLGEASGVSSNTIALIERGEVPHPNLETIEAMLRPFGLTVKVVPNGSVGAFKVPKDENEEAAKLTAKSLAKIKDRRVRGVMALRLIENKTLQEIGFLLGITKERVRQLEAKGREDMGPTK